jgi:ferritin
MLQPVPAPQFDFADYADALDYLLKVEQGVTMALNRIVEEAGVVGCYPTQELIWPLLPIQVQSEKTLNDALIKVRRSNQIDLLDFELWEG